MSTGTSTPRYAVIDCETTGLGRYDRIVEICVVTLDPLTWEPIDEYDTLINPQRDVGPVGIHGITASMVEAAPSFHEIAATLSRRLHGAILIAHNLSFDTRMLKCEFQRLGIPFDPGSGFCTLRATGEKLIAACHRWGIALKFQHRALADARATAALAREVREILTDKIPDPEPTTLGSVPQPLQVRTLRRESFEAPASKLTRVVSLAHYPSTDEVLLQYLDALDWVLDDRHIDDKEHAALEEVASTLGLSPEQRHEAHRSYLASIIAAAERDSIITQAEQRLISQIAEILTITDVPIPQVTQLPETSGLHNGMRVCFTGEAIVAGESVSRSFLEGIAAQAGMQPVGSVTKKGCDLLVAADPSTQSGKAATARRYDLPVMAAVNFLQEIGYSSAR